MFTKFLGGLRWVLSSDPENMSDIEKLFLSTSREWLRKNQGGASGDQDRVLIAVAVGLEAVLKDSGLVRRLGADQTDKELSQ